MSNAPLVSVIVIFLNEERFIEEAVESVMQQTYAHWELLLVDDGSTDKSSAMALRRAQADGERVRYFEHKDHQNGGMSASRNLGIRNARGRYIAFLDADDVWLPHKLEKQVGLLESHTEVGLVCGPAEYWFSWRGNLHDKDLDKVERLALKPKTVIEPPQLLKTWYPLGSATPAGISSIMLRREVVESVWACPLG